MPSRARAFVVDPNSDEHPRVPAPAPVTVVGTGERLDWWHEPDDDEGASPVRAVRPRRAPGPVDRTVTIVTTVAAFVLAPVAWFAVVIGQMAFTGCSSEATCAYDVGSVVTVAHPIVTAVVAVLGRCWATVRRRRGRSSWGVGLGTLVAVLAVFAAAVLVTDVASGGHLV